MNALPSVSCSGNEKGIRTPWNEERSKTERNIVFDSERYKKDVKEWTDNFFGKEAKNRNQLRSSGARPEDSPNVADFREEDKEYLCNSVQNLYDLVWTSNSDTVKTFLLIWMAISTFTVLRWTTALVNVYWSLDIDDCQTARDVCRRFGFACFTECDSSKWDVFMYRTFGG